MVLRAAASLGARIPVHTLPAFVAMADAPLEYASALSPVVQGRLTSLLATLHSQTISTGEPCDLINKWLMPLVQPLESLHSDAAIAESDLGRSLLRAGSSRVIRAYNALEHATLQLRLRKKENRLEWLALLRPAMDLGPPLLSLGLAVLQQTMQVRGVGRGTAFTLVGTIARFMRALLVALPEAAEDASTAVASEALVGLGRCVDRALLPVSAHQVAAPGTARSVSLGGETVLSVVALSTEVVRHAKLSEDSLLQFVTGASQLRSYVEGSGAYADCEDGVEAAAIYYLLCRSILVMHCGHFFRLPSGESDRAEFSSEAAATAARGLTGVLAGAYHLY